MKAAYLTVLTWFLVLVLPTNNTLAQDNQLLNGKVYYLNSESTPAVGVEVSGKVYGNEVANVVFSKEDGSYQLVFPEARVGHRVDLNVGDKNAKGETLEIVNDAEVSWCLVPARSSEVFEIIVCRKGERDEAAMKYYRILKSAREKELERSYAELERLGNQQSSQHREEIRNLQKTINLLQRDSDSLSIYRKAFDIASINRDKASDRMINFLNLLDQGKSLEEAEKALDGQEALKELRAAVRESNEAREELEQVALNCEIRNQYRLALSYFDSLIVLGREQELRESIIARYYTKAADLLNLLNEYEKAVTYQRRGLDLYEQYAKLGTEAGVAYNNMSVALDGLQEYDEALNYANKAIGIISESGDSSVLGQVNNSVGALYGEAEEFEKAIEHITRAVHIHEALGDTLNLIYAYNNLSQVHFKTGDYAKTAETLTHAEALGEAFFHDEPSLLMAAVYSNISFFYMRFGVFPESLAYLEKSKRIYDEEIDSRWHPHLAGYYINLGHINEGLHQYDESVKNLNTALEIGKRTYDENDEFMVETYGTLMAVYNKLERCQVAISIFEEKIQPFDSTQAIPEGVYLNAGQSYLTCDRKEEANSLFEKSLERAIQVLGEDHPNLAANYNAIAVMYENNGDLNSSMEYQLKAIALYEKVYGKYNSGYTTLQNNLSQLYFAMGEYDSVQVNVLRTVDLLRSPEFITPDTLNLGTAFHLLGRGYREQGELSTAVSYHLEAIGLLEAFSQPARRTIGIMYVALAETYLISNSFDAAKEALENPMALELKSATSAKMWALYYATIGEEENALDHLEEAVALGFNDYEWLRLRFRPLRVSKDKRFKEISRDLRKK